MTKPKKKRPSLDIPAVMTIEDASEVLQMHHTTLRTAIHEGRLEACQPTGRAYRITREQLLSWLSSTSTSTKTA